MKVGDLVKLAHATVVAWGDPDDDHEGFLDVPNETRFDGGKVVVLLELRSYDGWSSRVAWVLVDGRRGWAWEHELGEL